MAKNNIKKRTRLTKFLRFLKLKILHVSDTPKRIAMGGAIGMFVAWSPLFGLHLLIALLIALVMRANKIVALVVVWVANPLTMVPVLYGDYRVGLMITKLFGSENTAENSQVKEGFAKIRAEGLGSIFSAEFWQKSWEMFCGNVTEVIIGSVVMGLLAAAVTYWMMYHAIVWHRKKKPRRRHVLNQ